LTLAGILLAAGWQGRLQTTLAGVCALYGAWLAWQGLSARSFLIRSWIKIAMITADVGLAVAAVVLSGGVQSLLWWALLLPAASGARLFELWAGVGSSLGGWAVAVGIIMVTSGVEVAWQPLALIGVGLLGGALAVAWGSLHWPTSEPAPDAHAPLDDEAPPNFLGEILRAASRLNETIALDQLGLRIIDLVKAVLSDEVSGLVMRPAGLWIGSQAEGDWELTIGFAPGQNHSRERDPSALGKALISGDPQVVSAPGKDAFVKLWPGLEAAGTVVIVPLTLPNGTSLGAVLMGVDWDKAPSANLLNRLRSVGSSAALVWENASRYQAVLREKDQLNELQEEARKRLARNLHDGPTQTIASIAMRANFARRQITRDPDAAVQEVAKVEEMARQTTREIRHMLFTLRPLILESQGLGPALYQLALKARDSHDEDIQLEIDPDSTSGMDPGVQGALFYIVEEAVTNAQKHAAAEHIWIRLKREAERMRLEVEDDGVGFNVGAVDAHYEQRGSLGMVNMRERAELAGGVLGVKSAEGEGTRIWVSLPLGQDTNEGKHV
jgi:signal transduction histidine kinase